MRNTRLASASRQLCMERLEQRAMLAGQGLTAQYFHNPDLSGLAVERTEAVDFYWRTGSPAPGVDGNSFSARWIGQVEALYSETYAFRTVADDGVRLWVDGQLLVDDWTSDGVTTHDGTIALAAGKKYDIRLEYYDDVGSAEVSLQWASNSQSLEAIPAAQLYASPSGLSARYLDDQSNSSTQIVSVVDFNWGPDGPVARSSGDNFQATYTGFLKADYSEQYTFVVDSAGLTRLWIDDELIIDNWTEHAATTDAGTVALESGKWYDVRLEFQDQQGDAEVSLGWSSPSQTGGAAVEIVPSGNLLAAQPSLLTFSNPIGRGYDPYALQWNGQYLLVRAAGESIRISRADQLQDVVNTNPHSEETLAWNAPDGTNYSHEIWAPELHHLDGKWYIYFAASNGSNSTHRMHVLERDSSDPFGPYVYKGQITPVTDRWAIDGTVLSWQGKQYFIWSGWSGASSGAQNLYIAEMSNPWTLATDRSLISTPQYSWEQHGLSINEGPQVLVDGEHLHIIYSGSGYWSPDYALGRLTYDGTGSLLSAANWVKNPTPVFSKSSEVVGTGHASFTKSPDGTENWIVFHAHNDPSGFSYRVVHIQPFVFESDGTPNFGSPLPLESVIVAPSPSRPRTDEPVFLEADFDSNREVNAQDLAVWHGQFGANLFPGSSADVSGNGVVDGADFLAWQRNFGRDAASAPRLAESQSEADAGNMPQVASPSAFFLTAPAANQENVALLAQSIVCDAAASPVDSTAAPRSPVSKASDNVVSRSELDIAHERGALQLAARHGPLRFAAMQLAADAEGEEIWSEIASMPHAALRRTAALSRFTPK